MSCGWGCHEWEIIEVKEIFDFREYIIGHSYHLRCKDCGWVKIKKLRL